MESLKIIEAERNRLAESHRELLAQLKKQRSYTSHIQSSVNMGPFKCVESCNSCQLEAAIAKAEALMGGAQ